MATSERPDVKYAPRRCQFLNLEVLAVLTNRRGRGWRAVNCLDKQETCCNTGCVFAVHGGQWPFAGHMPDIAPQEAEGDEPCSRR